MIFEYTPATRPSFDMFRKELNRFEQQLGWFWFKGRKISVSPGVKVVEIPYAQISVRDIYENHKEKSNQSNVLDRKSWKF